MSRMRAAHVAHDLLDEALALQRLRPSRPAARARRRSSTCCRWAGSGRRAGAARTRRSCCRRRRCSSRRSAGSWARARARMFSPAAPRVDDPATTASSRRRLSEACSIWRARPCSMALTSASARWAWPSSPRRPWATSASWRTRPRGRGARPGAGRPGSCPAASRSACRRTRPWARPSHRLDQRRVRLRARTAT